MEVITIQSKAFQEIVGKLDAIHERLNARGIEPNEQWLDNQELMQLLKISRRTAQHYRDSGLIGYSQVKNKLYYRLSDVQQMLQKHYKKAFAK